MNKVKAKWNPKTKKLEIDEREIKDKDEREIKEPVNK